MASELFSAYTAIMAGRTDGQGAEDAVQGAMEGAADQGDGRGVRVAPLGPAGSVGTETATLEGTAPPGHPTHGRQFSQQISVGFAASAMVAQLTETPTHTTTLPGLEPPATAPLMPVIPHLAELTEAPAPGSKVLVKGVLVTICNLPQPATSKVCLFGPSKGGRRRTRSGMEGER